MIQVRELRYSYPDGTRALDGISVSVGAGESVALLGPNGSGKTTFLLHLNGLLKGEGDIRVCGQTVNGKNLSAVRQKVGLLFQEADDQLFMPTVREDVAFGPLTMGMPTQQADEVVRRTLSEVGLAGMEKRAPYHLSAGEKRRAALAGILAMNPEILVLDEPSTSLDPPGRAAFIELLRPLKQTKLIASHDLDLVRKLCTRALFFQKGRIVCDGPVESVIQQMKWEF